MNKAYDVKKVDWFYCKLIMLVQIVDNSCRSDNSSNSTNYSHILPVIVAFIILIEC